MPGPFSSLGAHARPAEALPADIGGACTVVQGLVLHAFWAARYGVTLGAERKAETNLRRLDRLLREGRMQPAGTWAAWQKTRPSRKLLLLTWVDEASRPETRARRLAGFAAP